MTAATLRDQAEALARAENPQRFVRKEREHITVLQQRLDHLRADVPSRSGDPEYRPGEANALAWALDVLAGAVEPIDVRLTRIEKALRRHDNEIGNLRQLLDEADS